jgi:3-isopropylmalate dehydrogenase
MILSVAMLIEWMGQKHGQPAFEQAAAAMSAAVDKVLEDPASRTPDLGGKAGTQAFAAKVAQAIIAA